MTTATTTTSSEFKIVLDLDERAGTGTYTYSPMGSDGGIEAGAAALPEGWAVSGFTNEELHGPVDAAAMAELSSLPPAEWDAWGFEEYLDVVVSGDREGFVETGVVRVHRCPGAGCENPPSPFCRTPQPPRQ